MQDLLASQSGGLRRRCMSRPSSSNQRGSTPPRKYPLSRRRSTAQPRHGSVSFSHTWYTTTPRRVGLVLPSAQGRGEILADPPDGNPGHSGERYGLAAHIRKRLPDRLLRGGFQAPGVIEAFIQEAHEIRVHRRQMDRVGMGLEGLESQQEETRPKELFSFL